MYDFIALRFNQIGPELLGASEIFWGLRLPGDSDFGV